MELLAVIALAAALVVLWGVSSERSARRKPPASATPAQLAAVDEYRRGGYDVEWLEDGTAHLYAPTRKSLHVTQSGGVMLRDAARRRARRH